MKSREIFSLDRVGDIVEMLYALMPECAVFTFTGPLGAGKTTLIKHLLARCGVKELVTSPTFTYVAVYINTQGQIFHHFDLYRLKELSEFREAGFEEYLYAPHSWAFIEWPEIIMPLLTHNVCHVTLDYYTEFERVLWYEIQ